MSSLLSIAASDLVKREPAQVVAATGLVFQRLTALAAGRSVEQVASSRGGVWGDATAPGTGYPVLRSTNMRGQRVDVIDPAWCDVPERLAQACSLETGDILVTKSSGSSDLVGKAALFLHPCDGQTYLFSNFTLRLRPDNRVVLPEYLAWFLRSPQSLQWRHDAQQNAVGLRNLQTKEFLQQCLPVPSKEVQRAVVDYLDAVEAGEGQGESVSLPPEFCEQRRIVARIEALAARIAEARGLRQAAKAEAEALMATARVTCFGREPANDWIPLDTYVRHIENGWSPACENRPASGNEWGVLKVGAVSFGSYNPGENKALPTALQPDTRYEVQVGDFLMSRANTRELVGASAVVETTPSRLMLSDKIFRFVFQDNTRIDLRYLDHVMKSPAVREQIERKASGTSPTMKNISKESVLNLLLPLHQMHEQCAISAYLDDVATQVNAVKHLQQVTASEIDALLPALLDRAFRGEL